MGRSRITIAAVAAVLAVAGTTLGLVVSSGNGSHGHFGTSSDHATTLGAIPASALPAATLPTTIQSGSSLKVLCNGTRLSVSALSKVEDSLSCTGKAPVPTTTTIPVTTTTKPPVTTTTPVTTAPTTTVAPTTTAAPTTTTAPATTTTAPVTGNCTNPIATETPTTSGTWFDGYNTDPWAVTSDTWNGSHGPQSVYICSYSSWYAVSNQTNQGGAVETYPDTQYIVGGSGEPTSTVPLSSFTQISSTFSEAFPVDSTSGWDAAYDLFDNYWQNEVMIWNAWNGANSYWPSQATTAVTIGGVGYKFLDNGGELMFFRDTQVASGSVDILAAYQWLIAQGYLTAADAPTELCYGVEISYTGGNETFPLNGLTMSVSHN